MRKRKRLLYVTFESFSSDPILYSQCLPLLNCLDIFDSKYLLTTDDNSFSLEGAQSFNHIKTGGSISKIITVLKLFRFLLGMVRVSDVVHVRGYILMPVILMLRFFIPFKLIFDPRGLFLDEYYYKYNRKNMFFRVFQFLEPFFYKKSDVVIVVSNFFRDHVYKEYSVSSVVIPTFSKPPHSRLNILPSEWRDKVVLVYSGSLEKWQRFDDVIEIVRYLSRFDEFRFAFFSTHTDTIRARLANVIDPRKFFVECLPSDKLPNAFLECDYGFLLRNDLLLNRVSSPIKLKDYMAAGLISIVDCNVGDITHENSQYFLDVNSDELSEMLRRKNHSRPYIQNYFNDFFSLEVVVEKYKDVYEKL